MAITLEGFHSARPQYTPRRGLVIRLGPNGANSRGSTSQNYSNLSLEAPNERIYKPKGSSLHCYAGCQCGPGSSWDVFSSIPGWSTDSGAGIEVQTTRTGIITPNSDHHYIELDSHGSSSNSNIYQDIAFTTGAYQLSFWYSPRVNDGGGTNTIEYSIGTSSVDDSVLGGSVNGPGVGGTSVGTWTQITDTFTVTSDTTLTLSFQAAGEDETLGGFIDDVSITAVPLPAAAWLFGSALFGLVTMSRRRKATA